MVVVVVGVRVARISVGGGDQRSAVCADIAAGAAESVRRHGAAALALATAGLFMLGLLVVGAIFSHALFEWFGRISDQWRALPGGWVLRVLMTRDLVDRPLTAKDDDRVPVLQRTCGYTAISVLTTVVQAVAQL